MTEAGKYAEAIFLIATENNDLDATESELSLVNKLLIENPDYVKLLDSPAIKKEERLSLVKEAFSSLSECVSNLLMILTEKRRMHTYSKLYSDFKALYNEKTGVVSAEVVSAVSLTDRELSLLTEKLSKKLSKKVELKNTVDKSIIGGILLRYGSVQLDASVKTRLDGFAEGLKKVTI